MAKVLVLSGSLSEKEKSYSSQMLDLFVKTYKEVHPNDELEFVDLNTTKHAEVFLSRNTFATYWKDVESDKWIDKLKAADKVILSCSMTNFGPTVVVKNFIDSVAVANKTFSYKYSKKGDAVGLLDHLRVMIVTTQGAPKDWYLWGSHTNWLIGTWKFLGAKYVDTFELNGTKLSVFADKKPYDVVQEFKQDALEKAKQF